MMQGEVQLQPTETQKLSGTDEMIMAEDSESGSACCRFCLMEKDSGGGDELISPCMCKGTMKFVHRSCLDHWRSLNDGGFAFSNCTTCNSQFHLPDEQPFDDINNSWRRRLIDAWWVFMMFLTLQPAVAVCAGGAYMMDTDGEFRNSFKNGLVRILAKHPILFYYSIGFVGFFGMLFSASFISFLIVTAIYG